MKKIQTQIVLLVFAALSYLLGGFSLFKNQAMKMNLLLKQDDYIGIELATELAAMYEYRVENTPNSRKHMSISSAFSNKNQRF